MKINELRVAKFSESSTIAIANSLIYKPLNLTLNEARLFFMLVSQIENEDEEFKTYKIFVRDIINIVKPRSEKNMYAQVKSDMMSLENKKIDYSDGNKSAPIRLLVEPVYHEREGYITARIHHLLKPELLKLKREFTVGLLCEMLRFKSINTQRIYLLIRQYQNAKSKVNRIEVDELKNILGLSDKYPRYNDFKKRVISPALEEINETGLKVKLKEHRKGRSVVMLDFIIVENKAKELAPQPEVASPLVTDENTDEKLKRLQTRLSELGLSAKLINELIFMPGIKDSKEIWSTINEIKMKKRDGKISGSVSAYATRTFMNMFDLAS